MEYVESYDAIAACCNIKQFLEGSRMRKSEAKMWRKEVRQLLSLPPSLPKLSICRSLRRRNL